MALKRYTNFVRATDPCTKTIEDKKLLVGDEAKKIYLEEVGQHNTQCTSSIRNVDTNRSDYEPYKNTRKRKIEESELSNLSLFSCVQNNDIDKLRQVLDTSPDKINTLDEFGWSLLMIACQANSIEIVKELLTRRIDTTVRDKAGNSAQSLVIKNKNVALASILLDYRKQPEHKVTQIQKSKTKPNTTRLKDTYVCEICENKTFLDKAEHLSSTIHNINASKGKKIPSNYVIPRSNKGYQIMLKVGWNTDTGLGPDGSGKQYPIKTVPKNDRVGLGHGKRKQIENINETSKQFNKKSFARDYQNNRKMEINFRREFY